jgi:isoquinoline 1-oxidoreductase alpha subunit
MNFVQKAWIDHNVPQCGYCQPGQIMQATSLIANSDALTKEQLLAGMSANLCRCGTYDKIRLAVIDAAKSVNKLV